MRKEEIAFVVAMLVFGIIAGVWASAILMAIAVPTTGQYLLTTAEKADWERMEEFARFFTDSAFQPVLADVVFFAGIAVVVLFLSIVNPQVRNALKNWRSKAGAKLLIALLAAVGWLCLLAAGLDMSGKPAQLLVLVAGTAVLWLIAGELGWAGDFTSWGTLPEAKPQRAVLFGAATGAALFALANLVAWSLNKYLILVSEVLGRSGETSFLGFKLLMAGFIVLFGAVFPILAGFIIALAPVRRDTHELWRRLRIPLSAFLAVLLVLAVAYVYAGKKYDLDKDDLAQILKVPDKARTSRTIVAFLPSKKLPVTLQEWPLQVSGSGMAVHGTMALSEENLKNLEAYLDAHRDGSVFTYAGRDMLVKGYYALWDVEKGLNWQMKAAESQLIHRLLLLARFRYLPVTDENLKLLRLYSDEKAWYAGGKALLSIAAAYRHFGKTAEAGRWFQKAKDGGVELPQDDFMTGPVVTAGTVRGKIRLNGTPLAGVRVALLGHAEDGQKNGYTSMSDMTLTRVLADVRETGADGGFVFSALGSGKYLLAIMTNKEVIHADVKPEKFKARNVPGVIQIGPSVMRDLGTIEMMQLQ